MHQKLNFGQCDIDKKPCYANGAICRLNPHPSFTFKHKGQDKKEPFRNKECSHYKETPKKPSEYEKSKDLT